LILGLILSVFLPGTLFGQRVIEIDDKKDEYVLGFDYLEILEDSTRKLTLPEVQADSKKWMLNKEEFPFNKKPGLFVLDSI
jgi:hypothetical protein